MWSDRPSQAGLKRSVAAVRSVLLRPRGGARTSELALASRASPEQVAHLLQEKVGFVWLDGGPRRHLLFRDPIAIVSSGEAGTRVEGPGGAVTLPGSSFDTLEAALRAWAGPHCATMAGWIAYEAAGDLEDVEFAPSTKEELPRLHFGLYDSVLIHEPESGWSAVGTDAWRGSDGWPRSTSEENALLLQAEAVVSPFTTPDIGLTGISVCTAAADASFLEGVRRIVRRIHAGDLFQANLCRRIESPLAAELAWPLYGRLRALSSADHAAFLQIGEGRSILSMSPEIFLTVRNGRVESFPIKGTRRRGETIAEDLRLLEDLKTSEKDRAELAMVVDVARNDLARVCEPGSIQVLQHAAPMVLPAVHHTYSRVVGQMKADRNLADLLRAAFPPASITGAPKIAAMEAAFREEKNNRGPCMGSIGWISMAGEMELSVAIRTAFTRDSGIVYLAGCGITAESIPEIELQESRTKAAAFLRCLASLGRRPAAVSGDLRSPRD